jgi:hypothetical protein
LDNVDVSSIPANVVISKAELNLYLTGYEGSGGTNPMRIRVYRISANEPDIATVTWANYNGTVEAAESITEVGIAPGFYRFDITNMVQWAYANSSNLYFALDGSTDGEQDTNRTFAAADHGTAAYRPFIGINYTQQDPGGGIPTSAPGRWQISIGNMNF